MKNLIDRYFKDVEGQNIFFAPADLVDINAVQKQLDFVLPEDYRNFLEATNGFEGFIGKFYAIFEPVEGIAAATKDSCAEYFPWAICIGSNGNLEMFVLDRRTIPCQYGLLPFIGDEDDFIPLGHSFEGFIQRLFTDTAFER